MCRGWHDSYFIIDRATGREQILNFGAGNQTQFQILPPQQGAKFPSHLGPFA
jgi:hypothetical protein